MIHTCNVQRMAQALPTLPSSSIMVAESGDETNMKPPGR